jgi:hypothetical protein
MNDGLLFDASDEEELREQLDMHSIIVSCVNEEPLFTADQVWSGSLGLRAVPYSLWQQTTLVRRPRFLRLCG